MTSSLGHNFNKNLFYYFVYYCNFYGKSSCLSQLFRLPAFQQLQLENVTVMTGNYVQKHKILEPVFMFQTIKPPLLLHVGICLGTMKQVDKQTLLVEERGRQKVDNQDQTPLCADER